MQMIPLLGFAPDRPSSTPGIMLSCTNIVPATAGFTGAPSAIAPLSVGALAAPARGGAVGIKLDGTRRVFAGTQTALYELVGTTWTNVSRGLAYTGSSENRWSFCQFGNFTIAANDQGGTPIQATATGGGGSFADIAAAPAARIVMSVANFVLALNTNDATFGDEGDRWRCSALLDHTSWAVSVSTQANSGRLVAVGGDILAGLPLGQTAVAYKARAMFVGTYVGSPVVWQWDQVPSEAGCVGQEAVCDANGVHVFVGEDNIWAFDGTRPVPLGDGEVREWLFNDMSPTYKYRTMCAYERQNNRVWIMYPASDTADGTPNRALVYHMKTGRWGCVTLTAKAVMNFIAGGITIDGLASLAGTIDGLPAIGFDSPYWLAGARSFAIFDASNQVRTLTGTPGASSFTTGDIGDDSTSMMVRAINLRTTIAPTTGSAQGQTASVAGGTYATGGAGVLYEGLYGVRQHARWHRFTFNLTGPVEFDAFGYEPGGGGRR